MTNYQRTSHAAHKLLNVLQVLAAAGVASRRAAEDLIFAGDVKLNGQVVTAPQTLAHPQQDKVCILRMLCLPSLMKGEMSLAVSPVNQSTWDVADRGEGQASDSTATAQILLRCQQAEGAH